MVKSPPMNRDPLHLPALRGGLLTLLAAVLFGISMPIQHPNLVHVPLPREDPGVPGDRPTADARAAGASD
jgi:hypothetical protein